MGQVLEIPPAFLDGLLLNGEQVEFWNLVDFKYEILDAHVHEWVYVEHIVWGLVRLLAFDQIQDVTVVEVSHVHQDVVQRDGGRLDGGGRAVQFDLARLVGALRTALQNQLHRLE